MRSSEREEVSVQLVGVRHEEAVGVLIDAQRAVSHQLRGLAPTELQRRLKVSPTNLRRARSSRSSRGVCAESRGEFAGRPGATFAGRRHHRSGDSCCRRRRGCRYSCAALPEYGPRRHSGPDSSSLSRHLRWPRGSWPGTAPAASAPRSGAARCSSCRCRTSDSRRSSPSCRHSRRAPRRDRRCCSFRPPRCCRPVR
jgi:hypothetical protein